MRLKPRLLQRGKRFYLLFSLALASLLAIPAAVAIASSVDESIVDATDPTGAVELDPGTTGNATVKFTVTGRQQNAASFDAYTKWTLKDGVFTGSAPTTIQVPARAATDPTTVYSVSGTITVDSSQAEGTYTLKASAFNIQTTSPAALSVGSSSSYAVTVKNSCSTSTDPAGPVISPNPATDYDGSNGWFKTIPTVSATTTTSGATITYATSTDNGVTKSSYSATAPTLTDGTTIVYAKATNSCGKVSESSAKFMIDTQDPATPVITGLTDDTGSSNSDEITKDDTPTFTGTAEAGSSVQLYKDGSAFLQPGLADSTTGAWSIGFSSSDSALADGEYSITAQSTDAAGNSTESDALPVEIDTTAPAANCGTASTSWSASDASITCAPTDSGGSGLAASTPASFHLVTNVPADTETNNASTDSREIADVAGNTATAGPSGGNKVDKKAPEITDAGPTASPDGTNQWYKSAVTNNFNVADGGSGLANGVTSPISVSSGTQEGSSIVLASGAVADQVGNSASSINSAAFKIDLSNPYDVAFASNTITDGTTYDFGENPAAPTTCSAKDDVSGLLATNGCVVADSITTGGPNAVGTHKLTATATDKAGRTATTTLTYTIRGWKPSGFYQPTDMGGIVNTVKNGSTVPLKFEVFKQDAAKTELTSTSIVNQPLKATQVTCDNGAVVDDIELLATGSTALRYDTTAGQFIYNWQTPKKVGACYEVSVTMTDGSTIGPAKFKLK